MVELLVLKEKLRAFYGGYDTYVASAVKFFLAFTTLYLLNQSIGFMGKLKNPMVPLLLSVISVFLPYGATAFLTTVSMLFHLYSVSSEMALVMLIVLVIVGILYYGFRPGNDYLLLITPIPFFLKISYTVPLLVGLSGSLMSVIPVSCGAFFFYAIQYVKQNAGISTNDVSVNIIQKYAQVIKALFNNQLMMVMIAAFAVGTLVVYVVHTLSMDYAWWAAIIAGTVIQVAAVFVEDFVFGVSIPMGELLFGAVVSMGVATIYTFFTFTVDCSRAGYLQYEDDGYHYYVRAVPKIVVFVPDVKMQKINIRRGQRNMRD